MAGGKETPRQKMIGMMYLVLTALLALQVNSAILLKFKFIDDSLLGVNDKTAVAADGTVGAAHPFTKTCLSLPSASTKNAPKALVVTQLLDPLPTEIDVFTMFAARLPLCIGTPDGRIWSVESSGGQARIRLLPADAKKK